MIFGINTTIEISLVVFMPNITTNRAITYTNTKESTNGQTCEDGIHQEIEKFQFSVDQNLVPE